MARRRTKSVAEPSNSPPPAAIARSTRSRKSLVSSLLETQQPPPMAPEQGSTGQRRSSRSAPKRGEGLAPSPTTGVGPMMTRGKQAKDESDGKDKDHEDEAPRDHWRSPEFFTKPTATPPPIPDARDDDDDESLVDEADKKDEGHIDEDRQDDVNDYGQRDEDEGNVLPGPLSANSSPDGQGSYTSSLNGRDRMSSPSASRNYDTASAKRRRKKTRNPHISPNKQRQLRQKQKEREGKKKCDVVSSPVSATGSGSGAFPYLPYSSVPVATEGIHAPASPPLSIPPPAVNLAFEEDFGPLLNFGTNTQEAGERPGTPVDTSSVDAAAEVLLGTAMGGFSEDEGGERASRDSSLEAEQSVTVAPETQDTDMPDVPAQSSALLLNAASNDPAIVESPSNQLLAELQKNGDDATESTLSGQASPIIAGMSTPATTVNGIADSHRARCVGGESSSRSQDSPGQGLGGSKTGGISEKDILNISFGRRLSLGPSCADISERNNANMGDSTIKENNTKSRESNTRLVVRDGPPSPKLERRDTEIVLGGSPTKITSPRERIEIRVQLEDQDPASVSTDEASAAASVLLQMLNPNNLVPTIGRKRSHSEISSRGGGSSPGQRASYNILPCPTCPITVEQILSCLERKNAGDRGMSLEDFMDKHHELCSKNIQDESLVSEGEMEEEDEYGDYGEEEGDEGEEGNAGEGLCGELEGEEEDSAVDGDGELVAEVDRAIQKTVPTPSGAVAALCEMAGSLPGYLSIKPEDISKEIEIRRSAITAGRLPEGKSVEDILFVPITPVSTFQEYLENSKTPAEKFLVEEKIVEALADMQVEYLMIDEIIKRKEASTPDGERAAVSRPLRSRQKRKPRVVCDPLEPEDPVVWEDKKEAELYGFSYDPAIDKRGKQNADEQQAGKYSIRGRELRSRQKAVEMVLYPGYEHIDQRVQTIQPKATRRRKPAADKEKGGESLEQLRAGSAPPPVSATPQKKRPGRPPKNAQSALFLSAAAKDQASAQALSRTHSADNVARPRVGEKPKVDPNRTPPSSISGTLGRSPPDCLKIKFRGARLAEYLNIVSQESNLPPTQRDFYSRPGPSSLVPATTQSEPVSPTRFYPDKHTRQGDSFISLMNGGVNGQRSESPVYDSAESNPGDHEGVGRGRPRSRGRGRARGRVRGARGPGRPGRGSGLRVETAANPVGHGEPLSANPETPTPSAVEYSEVEDAVMGAASDRRHNYHSNAFPALSKASSSAKHSTPAVMRFNSTTPLFTVFPTRPGPHQLPSTVTSPTYNDNRSSAETDHGRPRVRGKTYKTPISVSLNEAQPKTTKEEEFIAAQNGNLGKRKRVKTALAYEAPRRKARAVAGRDGAMGSGHSPGSVSGERDDETDSSEPDDDDSGGYGNEK